MLGLGSCLQGSSKEVASTPKIGVLRNTRVEFASIAEQLAFELLLPLVDQEDIDADFSHVISVIPYEYEKYLNYSVSIQMVHSSPKRQRHLSLQRPFFVDFCPPPSSPLSTRSKGMSDLLVQAMGGGKGLSHMTVFDLTAGLGRDSFVLANKGAHVTMIERDSIISTLLKDALRRLEWLESLRAVEGDLSKRLSLHCTDAQQFLSSQDYSPDVIYLDPMFPARTKKALVKKNMQILHSILGSQSIEDCFRHLEEQELLRLATEAVLLRVVVKRLAQAETLGGNSFEIQPSYSIKGSTNRWDIYVVANTRD